MPTELTDRQMEQLDTVDNACHRLLCELAGREIEWDMELIGEVADTVQWALVDKLHLFTEMEFRPYTEE